jgi:hypothetical protein
MYESKREPGKKFGSIYAGRRFDSYDAGKQPGEENDNEHSNSKDHTGDKVNTSGPDKTPHDPSSESASMSTPSETVASHGPAHTTHVTHHEDGTHIVSSEHPDGTTHESTHGSAGEAHSHAEQLSLEEGGTEQASNVKRRAHYPQQGAESEDRNFEMPDLV